MLRRVGKFCFRALGAVLGVASLLSVASTAQAASTFTFAYVANSVSNSVSVIDLATNTVVDTITGFHTPRGVAVTPNNQYVYVSNSGLDTVSVISTLTNTVVATITVGYQPWGIAVTPNGNDVYVANYNGTLTSTFNFGTVSEISTATNTVVATIDLSNDSPEGLAISPDGDYVYTADANAGQVSAIATATNSVTNIPLLNGDDAFDVGVEPDNKYVYVTTNAYSAQMISVSSSGPGSDTVTALSGVYPGMQGSAIAFSTSLAFIAEGNNGSSVSYFPWGSTSFGPYNSTPFIGGVYNPYGVAISPDGLYVYITSANSGKVAVLPTSSLSSSLSASEVDPTSTITVGYGPEGIAIVQLTKQSNSITNLSTAPSAVVGGPTYTPSATATSGDTVVITVDSSTSSNCSISGGVVSFQAAGTCLLDFNDPGNGNYVAASQVQQSVNVGKGANSITNLSTAPSAVVGGPTYTRARPRRVVTPS